MQGGTSEKHSRPPSRTGRIRALDRARTFITLLVLLHHSVVEYTYFGSGDKMRWLGFDLVVLFNDSFFMACMFLISGLFVHDSLTRKGPAVFLRDRAWRLGIPFTVRDHCCDADRLLSDLPALSSALFLDFNFFHFWWRTLDVDPQWPSGPAWFCRLPAGVRPDRRCDLVGRAGYQRRRSAG